MVVIIEGLMMRLMVMSTVVMMTTSSSSKRSRHPPTARHILYPTLRRHSHSANKPPGIIRCPNIYPAQSQSMMDYSSHPYTYSTTVLHSSKTGYHEQKYECINWEKWIPWMPPLNMLSFSPSSANNAPCPQVIYQMSHWQKGPWLLAGPLFLLFGLKFSFPNIEKIHKIIPRIAAKLPKKFKTFKTWKDCLEIPAGLLSVIQCKMENVQL